MTIALILVTAVLLDQWLGEPRRMHPLVGLGTYAAEVEWRLRGDAALGHARRRLRGLFALAAVVMPPVLVVKLLPADGVSGAVSAVLILYLALGAASLREHASKVADALAEGDLPRARERVAMMVSRDTAGLDEEGVATACVESVLENGCDAVFGALFWFLLAGPAGVVAYRIANTLDAMWGYRNERYRDFGWAAARLDDVMNWIPARLTAASYVLLGHGATAWRCWRSQGDTWKSPNAGPVMAAGAGALRLRLGGEAIYHGVPQQRPPLGEGWAPCGADIHRAVRLVNTALLAWVMLVLGAALIAG